MKKLHHGRCEPTEWIPRSFCILLVGDALSIESSPPCRVLVGWSINDLTDMIQPIISRDRDPGDPT